MPQLRTMRNAARESGDCTAARFAELRLRKHSDYQRVYGASKKQFSRQMSYFFSVRPVAGSDGRPLRGVSSEIPRVGLTVGKVMGKAHDRNRIKRRMREAVRYQAALLPRSVDVILHPRRTVLDLPFPALQREVGDVFRAIQRAVAKQPSSLLHEVVNS